jgi:hypothetical protein
MRTEKIKLGLKITIARNDGLMRKTRKIHTLINKFSANLLYYKNTKNAYSEHSCRDEYIDPLLVMLGWDVQNVKGLAPQYREVIAENYSMQTDRPDYSLTLRGVTKIFVEAKKPSVDILHNPESALQARRYGWNAKHKIAILTNFENLVIYDTTDVPNADDGCAVARYRSYNYTDYADKFEEIYDLISRNSVYSGGFDSFFDDQFSGAGNQKQQVDELFLKQINQWRISLSNELFKKNKKYHFLDVLNDVVQEFINQIVFLRICEDRNLPLYHNLKDTVTGQAQLQSELEKLFRSADRRYNSGMFSGESLIFDINYSVISSMIQELYYPQSPYLFSIIEPNLLGKIYEMFLTEQLVELPDGTIGLAKKKDCANRSIVTTPTEVVRYMTEKSMYQLCKGKTPQGLLNLKIADIACGSGVFLEEAFEYLQTHCVEWYLQNERSHLIEIGNGRFKLPLDEKKALLCSCIYGIDIDIHAVEVTKFSLLVKLIEDETTPSVLESVPILPDLSQNILYGNSLISCSEIQSLKISDEQLVAIVPFNWNEINHGEQFDLIIGNPPYVNTENLHSLISSIEFELYKTHYKTAYKQFDKYFLFLERAIQKIRDSGFVCYIVPNKFFKVDAGKNVREIIAKHNLLVSLDDFGDAQLFEDKTIYSSILLLHKTYQEEFNYTNVTSTTSLWLGEKIDSITLKNSDLNNAPWRLTTDIAFLEMLKKLDKVSTPLFQYAEIFNGIQTSAERPTPVFWFSSDLVSRDDENSLILENGGNTYFIEKTILKPYFKPTKQSEKGLNSYSLLSTDKLIIFPYDTNGKLYSISVMKERFPGTYAYLEAHYDRLVPKSISETGTRDVPNATADTWYQYGRTQALTAFINTPKLIVGVLSKAPMYAYDDNDMLIASGGTAGYCAVSRKENSPYALEYIQAWLSNQYTERILELMGSDFEGGFIARGTFVLKKLPFVPLDFSVPDQKQLHDRIVASSKEIYDINKKLAGHSAKNVESVLLRKKNWIINEIEELISKVYRLEF